VGGVVTGACSNSKEARRGRRGSFKKSYGRGAGGLRIGNGNETCHRGQMVNEQGVRELHIGNVQWTEGLPVIMFLKWAPFRGGPGKAGPTNQ
jgi:hypothetical protein